MKIQKMNASNARIIGGTACDILMNKANLDFRATRDIDMILLIENRYEAMEKGINLDIFLLK